MDERRTDKNHQRSDSDDPRADQEVCSGGEISRREALSALGALAVLMGVSCTPKDLDASEPPPAWLTDDTLANYTTTHSAQDVLTVKEMLELIEEFRLQQTEPDMSDCIHMLNPDRMCDMKGHTVMGRVENHPDKSPGLSYKISPIVRNHA